MELNTKKKFSAFISIISNVILTLLKIIAGYFSGSISIVSEAIHSLSDVFASVLTFFSVSKSSLPADSDHPYGHGKYEDMSGFIEGLLIVFASLYIIYEALNKIITNNIMQTESNLGIIVMFVAVIANVIVSNVLFKTAKESNSVSLYADAQHLRTDIYSSLGVLGGLILIKITGYYIFDSIIAVLIALFIFKTGYNISKKTIANLLDHSLDEDDIEKIKNIIKQFPNTKLKENGIKTRQTGPSIDIDLILQFEGNTTIYNCHKICDEIETMITATFGNCQISIHSEPICSSRNPENDFLKIK